MLSSLSCVARTWLARQSRQYQLQQLICSSSGLFSWSVRRGLLLTDCDSPSSTRSLIFIYFYSQMRIIGVVDHWTQGERSSQIPQVLPRANLMNPCSPHEAPQEFLILQQLEVRPTSWMSWLRFLPQLLKTPEAYLLQLVASAETPMGLLWMAFWTLVHPLAVGTLEILNDPPWSLQVWVLAVQGYWAVLAIPLSLTQARPWQLKPPLQPSFPYFPEQSTSCCSERLTVSPLERAQDSRTATALKAQHEPQLPWFLTGETCPLVVQSMSALMGAKVTSMLSLLGLFLGLRQIIWNSASVSPVN